MEKVLVAMSGGVDSSVAALLVHQAGYSTLGVSMQVWDYRKSSGSKSKATCCAPDDFTDARKVAARIGLPYYVFDFEKVFEKEVINLFVESYHQGLTPNPCIECNSKVKFAALRDRAESLGCTHVATGHYAEIFSDEHGLHLCRGRDADKDQSYFLYRLTQDELQRTLFPVGHMTKTDVRSVASKAGLSTAEKSESQDICFVSGDVGDFVEQIGRGKSRGAVVDRDGSVVGEHDGVHRFTIGQRRGVGVGGSTTPLYVVDIVPKSNRITVGTRNDLDRESFLVMGASWVAPQVLSKLTTQTYPITFSGIAQLRHRHRGVRCEVSISGRNDFEVRFVDIPTTVSPGQAAVIYDSNNREVLGGGTISREKGKRA